MLVPTFAVIREGWKLDGKQTAPHSRLRALRRTGGDYQLVPALREPPGVYSFMGLRGEGVRHVEEALEISGRLGDTEEHAQCLLDLVLLLHSDDQLDVAEEAAFRAIDFIPEKGKEYLVSRSRRVRIMGGLILVYESDDDGEFEVVLLAVFIDPFASTL